MQNNILAYKYIYFSIWTFTFTPAKVRVVFSQQGCRKQCDDKYTLDCLQLIEGGREDSTVRTELFQTLEGWHTGGQNIQNIEGNFQPSSKNMFLMALTSVRTVQIVVAMLGH